MLTAPGGWALALGENEGPQSLSRPDAVLLEELEPMSIPRPVSAPLSPPARMSSALGIAPELPAADEQDQEELPQGRFLDRERSWLAFNERVLELAEDPAIPLLERAKFLAIFASNLDEFFMVRVAGLKRRIATGVAQRSASGLQPREVLDLIWTRSRELMARHAAAFQQEVLPDLAAEGIELVRWPELAEKEQARLHTLFRQKIFPVLTPWRWTRRTPSRTYRGSPSTSPWSCATRSRATSTSPG